MIETLCEGIVINKRDFGEADRILDVFTGEYGKLTLTVPGIRKSRKRDLPAADMLSRSEFALRKKAGGFGLLRFTLIDSYGAIRERSDSFETALCLLAILNRFPLTGEKNHRLYDLTRKTLDRLKTESDRRLERLLLLWYLHRVIGEEGFRVDTEKKGDYLSLARSAFTKEKSDESCIFTGAGARQILDKLNGGRTKELVSDEAKTEIKDIGEVIGLYEKYINYHLGINLQFQNYLIGGQYD
ncbi:MAG: DNA repair protein RecO [Fusobacteriaceae bacterium]|jgi:DNA repair protein RecO (recombination protein O)|nr:DNA repair protein RecO [Fusobacteriaceae bacterium]